MKVEAGSALRSEALCSSKDTARDGGRALPPLPCRGRGGAPIRLEHSSRHESKSYGCVDGILPGHRSTVRPRPSLGETPRPTLQNSSTPARSHKQRGIDRPEALSDGGSKRGAFLEL